MPKASQVHMVSVDRERFKSNGNIKSDEPCMSFNPC